VEELQAGVQLTSTQIVKDTAPPRRYIRKSLSPELIVASDTEHINQPVGGCSGWLVSYTNLAWGQSDDDDGNIPSRPAILWDLSLSQDQPNTEPHTSSAQAVSSTRPRFGSDWNLSKRSTAKKKFSIKTGSATPSFPLKLDSRGRPIGNVQVGTRAKMNRHS
jgi:hypothetical protein